jgi:hypothetical protein
LSEATRHLVVRVLLVLLVLVAVYLLFVAFGVAWGGSS